MAINNTHWQKSHSGICSSFPERQPKNVTTDTDIEHSKATHSRELILEAKALSATAGIKYSEALEIITGIPPILREQAM